MVKIYQINRERDLNNVGFMPYSYLECFDFSIYDEIWAGDMEIQDNIVTTLEDIYVVFNIEKPYDFTGHSLSCSDLVEILDENEDLNGLYYCDRVGFKKLENIKRDLYEKRSVKNTKGM